MKVEEIYISGFKAAFRGMRNPYDSWEKSDSYFSKIETDAGISKSFEYLPFETYCLYDDVVRKNEEPVDKVFDIDAFIKDSFELDYDMSIGENDMRLARKLIKGGSVHSKFLRYITVTMDLTAPFDFWKQYDTYKVATVANSCSTMHTITKYKLTLDNFSLAGLRPKDIRQLKKNIKYLNSVINDDDLTDLEKTRICSKLLPEGFEQKRTIEINYATLEGMYKWRKNHKLLEWKWFCSQIIENLPYFKEFFINDIRNVTE